MRIADADVDALAHAWWAVLLPRPGRSEIRRGRERRQQQHEPLAV